MQFWWATVPACDLFLFFLFLRFTTGFVGCGLVVDTTQVDFLYFSLRAVQDLYWYKS